MSQLPSFAKLKVTHGNQPCLEPNAFWPPIILAILLQDVSHGKIIYRFPNLKALIIIQLIAAFIASSQQSGFILVMTFSGPNEATKVAGLLIFEKAYLYLKFGIATTMAWMLGIMLLGFTVIQLRKLSNMEFKAQGSK